MTAHNYQRPSKEITDVLDVGPTPGISISPTREFLLLIERSNYPPIEDLAAPMLKLAGLRINPQTNGPHLAPRNTGLILQSIVTDEKRRIDVPEGANIGFQGWSPDGRQFAFTVTTNNAIQLWIASVANASAQMIDGLAINGSYGVPVQWLPDSSGLLVQAIPADRGSRPEQPKAPPGPAIEESSGRSGPVRTYQDLLQNSHDEDLFVYYCSSQLAIIDVTSRSVQPIGPASLFGSVEVSPDGQHILAIRLERPFSYLLPASRFPKTIEVWNRTGASEHVVASLPLQDAIPIEGVPTGPRSVTWQPNQLATLSWLEALDDGDPRKIVPHRDRVLSLAVPFDSAPTELTKTEQRCTGIQWGETDGLALVWDYDRDRRWTRTFRINTEQPDISPSLMWERSVNDRYADPGSPLNRLLPNGQSVMWQHDTYLYLRSGGATPKGDRPFLDRYNLATGEKTRLFTCDDHCYESVIALLTDGSRPGA